MSQKREEKGAKSVKLDSDFSQAVNCCAMGKEKLEIQMFFSGQIATFAVVTFQFSFFFLSGETFNFSYLYLT